MSTPTPETLRAFRFLKGASDDELKLLVSIAREESHPAGTVLFKAGEQGSRFFLILEGAISLELTFSASNKRIQTIEAGELVGWSPLVGHTMKATARTMKESKLVSFDAAETLALCEKQPKFGFDLMRQIAGVLEERLNATRQQLLDACHHQLPDALPLGSREGAD